MIEGRGMHGVGGFRRLVFGCGSLDEAGTATGMALLAFLTSESQSKISTTK